MLIKFTLKRKIKDLCFGGGVWCVERGFDRFSGLSSLLVYFIFGSRNPCFFNSFDDVLQIEFNHR